MKRYGEDISDDLNRFVKFVAAFKLNMIGNVEKKRLLQEQIALRRLYYCHPLVLNKNIIDQYSENLGREAKSNEKGKPNRGPLLPARKARPNNHGLVSNNAWSSYPGAVKERRNFGGSTTRSQSADASLAEFDDNNLCIGKQIHPRDGAQSAPPVLFSRTYKEKKLLKKRETCLTNELKTGSAKSEKSIQRLNTERNPHESQNDLMEKNNMNQETSVLTFNRWGCRGKKKREIPVKSEVKSYWVVGGNGAGLEISAKRIHIQRAYDTKPVKFKGKEKIGIRSLTLKMNQAEVPLPPNPSPSLEKELCIDSATEKLEKDDTNRCQAETESKDPKNLTLEIVINPPEDHWEGSDDNQSVSDSGCLSPFIEDFEYDFESPPKTPDSFGSTQKNTEISKDKMFLPVANGFSSRSSSVLEDIIEVEYESDLEEDLTHCNVVNT